MITSIDTLPIHYVPGVRVFISHQRNDKDIAREVQKRLEKMRIKSFLDATDKGRDGYKSVTDWIIDNLRESTHVLVVYTDNTKKSAWVPFEIGVGYEREEGIAILAPQRISDMPNYLDEFPLMRDFESLKEFASFCRDYPKPFAKSTSQVHFGTPVNENVQEQSTIFKNDVLQKYSRLSMGQSAQENANIELNYNYARFFIDELKNKLR